jgi:protein-serine/threonine kinase
LLPITADSALVTANGESISSAIANQVKRRAYQGLVMSTNDTRVQNAQANKEKVEGHRRDRSISEYVPEAMQVPKTRHITVSGSHAPTEVTPESSLSGDALMRREPHLAVQRGLAPTKGPPTPPSSRTGGESDSDSSTPQDAREKTGPKAEFFDAKTRDGAKRRWRGLRILGEGTFSRVMLATSQLEEEEEKTESNDVFGQHMDGLMTPVPEAQTENRRKKLVAIKICEHGPKGGASEQRVEMSLKRELEIMISIHHPSLVHLKAWAIEETRAILVLSYCPGGDLFEVASQHRDLLIPSLLRRMFAELVAAVQHLHERHIVHRDIKLESEFRSREL